MAGSGKAGETRRLAAVVAMLALMLQVMVPAGFMVSATPGGPAIVICTGHGPLLVHTDHGQPARSPASKSGACAFAGHGGAPLAPAPLALAGVRFEAFVPAFIARVPVYPGRGMAAPPPPAIGPPAIPQAT
ncbi:MAG TPA: DUF2946 family protein [Caulobacteraceae bacterium]|jgi:hypothetical protein|nr:DUF2946 family protein [Caulobacteraceae bacterium]